MKHLLEQASRKLLERKVGVCVGMKGGGEGKGDMAVKVR